MAILERLEELVAIQQLIDSNEYYLESKIKDKAKYSSFPADWQTHADDTIETYRFEVARLKFVLSADLKVLSEETSLAIGVPHANLLDMVNKETKSYLMPTIYPASIHGALHNPEYISKF